MVSKRVVAAAAGAILSSVVAVSTQPAFERAGWFFYDVFQRATALPRAEGVTFVAISQGSLDDMRENPTASYGWPWPRSIYGAFVKVAKQVGARSVTFDGIFVNPSTEGVEDDREFGEAIRASGLPVVLGGEDGANTPAPNANILQAAQGSIRQGVVTVPQEDDGIYRRVPFTIRGRPTLAFAALAGDPSFENRKDETMWLRFYADHGIPFVEATDLFKIFRALDEGKPLTEELAAKAAQLKGSHLFVGASAPGLLDLKPLPTEPAAPGPLIHATALANWLSGQEVKTIERRAEGVLVAIVGFGFFIFVFFAVRPMSALFGGLSIALGGSLLLSFVSWLAHYWINPIPTFLSFSFFGLGVLGYRFQREWKERELLARSVENAMSTEMVDLIRTGQLKVTRFGERRDITILFSDLSGFTTISEKFDANVLVDLLNMYSDEAVELVFQHEGFLDKFIGDAVMAIWGAPVLGQTNHAKLGLKAAIGFGERVKRFNKKADAKYGVGEIFKARVGLHTGSAIVGNIGSHNRYNYTAIGDSVNLASRLEGIGKAYDCELLISEEALVAAGALDQKGFLLVDVMAVKGRSTPTRIYTYLPAVSDEQFGAYVEAFADYQAGRFSDAIPKFQRAFSVPTSETMISRCRNLETGFGAKHFKNGVWHHDEK